MPLFLGFHGLEDSCNAVEGSEKIGFQKVGEGMGPLKKNACAVDQDVDAPLFFIDILEGSLNSLFVADINRIEEGHGGNFCGGLGKGFGIAGEEGELMALAGKGEGNGFADPSTSTCNNSNGHEKSIKEEEGLCKDGKIYPRRLKNWISLSCFIAASLVLKVPRLRRLPVFGLRERE